ncbi:hypothetical protein [Brevibacillus dissolubilis]|uniref:hypothetical protein n=1 Tax=Brevibacillus dissolubilis TaxID=1844116 RepID=UPI001117942A|nr:hypothetical protein [Brevibacillus dissolubilis]
MEKIIGELLIKLEHVMLNLSEIEQLSRWADEKYHLFCKQGYDQYLRNRLIVDILVRLRDLNDPLLEEWEWGYKESHSSLYQMELEDIYEFMIGKKKYIEVITIQENLLEKLCKDFLVIYPSTTELLADRYLSSEAVEDLKKIKYLLKVNTRIEYILNEIVVAMLHINESLKHTKDILTSIGNFGKSNKITIQQEKKILQNLLDIIEGRRAYRLSVCIEKQELCYTNIMPL